MKIRTVTIALIAIVGLTLAVGFALGGPPSKVTYCHNLKAVDDTGDEYEGTTISVSEKSANAHEAHGDIEVDADYDNDGDIDCEDLNHVPRGGSWSPDGTDVDGDGDIDQINQRN